MLALYFFLRTLLGDPGVLPKQYHSTEAYLNRIPKNRWLHQTVIPVVCGSRLSDIKLCGECLLYRSADTYHCVECDVCVVGHDHHCAWMGKCIGRHNYKYLLPKVGTSSCSWLHSWRS